MEEWGTSGVRTRRGLHGWKTRALIAALACLSPSCVLTLDPVGSPAVQRPTFSNSTATTPHEGLSLEMGADLGPSARLGVPTTFRWGAGPDTELTLGGLLHQRAADGASGMGDLEVGTRHRLRAPDEDTPGWAWGWLARLPVASTSSGLGSGEVDFQFSLSRDHLRGVSTVTWYYQLDFLGEPAGEGTDLQHLASWTLSRPLSGPWGITAELAGSIAPERDLSAGWLLLSTSLQVDPWTLLDFGVRFGVDDAEDWAALIGFGRSLGRLRVP